VAQWRFFAVPADSSFMPDDEGLIRRIMREMVEFQKDLIFDKGRRSE
jgi:hypothetical protein